MSEQAHYFRVGLFVLVGTVLLTLALILLGGRDLFTEPVVFETYLDESVQGLEVGSPVKFRGVQLGSVSHIGLVGDHYVLDTEEDQVRYGQLVMVEMKLSPPVEAGDREAPDEEERERWLQMRVDQGLRLRIASQGITGLSYMEADYVSPEANPPMKIVWKPDDLYVPSAPSTLEGLDIESVVKHLDELLVSMRKTTEDLNTAELSRKASELLADLRETSTGLRRAVDDAEAGALSGKAQAAIDDLRVTLAEIESLIQDSRYDVEATLENLRVVTEDLRDVSSTAKSYPSFILLGEPPKGSKAVSPK
jgi:paraquat-inducible protein B